MPDVWPVSMTIVQRRRCVRSWRKADAGVAADGSLDGLSKADKVAGQRVRARMLRADQVGKLVGLIALALILAALAFQYLGQMPVCRMCHWQRWAHMGAVLVGLVGVSLWPKSARALASVAVLLMAISGLIAAYQFGMQLGILPDPQVCKVDKPYTLGSNDPVPILCGEMGWTLLGLSLAGYNALISLITAVSAGALLIRRQQKGPTFGGLG